MRFTTDKQTLNDLNIFGTTGTDSVYTLFDRCITRAGAELLEEMFRYPLSDAQAINGRSAIIQSFASTQCCFPFERLLFDAIDPWLADTDERSQLTPGNKTGAKKLADLIAADPAYTLICKGVSTTITLLKGLQEFLYASPVAEAPAYAAERVALQSLLADPSLVQLLKESTKAKLSYGETAAADVLLRFRQRTLLKKILQSVYYLDVYIAIATVARERQFIFPVALADNTTIVRLEGVYHPLVKKAVPNELSVAAGNQVIFLTGANMAGKSTLMKTIGIALFLAHMGFPVAAEKMEFTVLDGIYTTINLPDDLGMGASHFYAEVLRMKMIAKELGQSKRLLVIFDELFRGTNVKDAYDATVAIASAFAQQQGSLFIISTHIIEAGETLIENYPAIQFVFLPTRMKGQIPEYTYKLETGISADRHGMVIIRNEKILDILEQGSPPPIKKQPHALHS